MYVCIHAFSCLFEQEINGISWIGWGLCRWCFSSLSDNGCNFLDGQTFSTARYFPPQDIFRTVTFWGRRSFPLRVTLGCSFFHHQTFSAMRHFPNPKHFLPQDIFSFNSLAHIQLPAPKIWKSWKKGYHFIAQIE